MLPVIAPSDFSGFLKISSDTFVSEEFQEFIDLYYPKYVGEITNDLTLYTMQNNALQGKYVDLMEGGLFTDKSGVQLINPGLKNVIKYFLYFQYVREVNLHTNTGNVRNKNENADNQTGGDLVASVHSRRNQGIELLLCKVYPFIEKYSEVTKKVVSFVDNGGGSYTIEVDEAKYLYDADLVEIDNISYEVSNVTANTFDILGSIGLDFTGTSVFYEPFNDFLVPKYQYGFN